MKTIKISDVTLRQAARQHAASISFKERIEIARTLDRLKTDVIELPVIEDAVADALANKTIASVVTVSALSAACGLSAEAVDAAWDSVKGAKKAALHVMVPVSAIQMEYQCHKKGPKMLELVKALVERARYHTENVAFSAVDATRASREIGMGTVSALVGKDGRGVAFHAVLDPRYAEAGDRLCQLVVPEVWFIDESGNRHQSYLRRYTRPEDYMPELRLVGQPEGEIIAIEVDCVEYSTIHGDGREQSYPVYDDLNWVIELPR